MPRVASRTQFPNMGASSSMPAISQAPTNRVNSVMDAYQDSSDQVAKMLKEHRNEKTRKNKTGYLSGMGISRSQTKNLSTSIS